jgi:rubrerythrin
MGMDIQEAIKRSIQTEKNAMYFYQLGAERMKDQTARDLFELLAREEREHAAQFYRIYKGADIPSLDDFLNTSPDNSSSWLSSISRLIHGEFSEKKALELSLEREKKLEDTLLATSTTINDPEVRAVFEMNARETHNHYLLIESDYARLMGMVDELDMDTYMRE